LRTAANPDRQARFGPVAQRIEQQPSKLKVAGSSPAGVAKKTSRKAHISQGLSAAVAAGDLVRSDERKGIKTGPQGICGTESPAENPATRPRPPDKKESPGARGAAGTVERALAGAEVEESKPFRKSAQAERLSTIALLSERFPGLFSTELDKVRPLAIGISDVLLLFCPDLPRKHLRRALRAYTDHGSYLRALIEGAPRIDLDGAPSGHVDENAALHTAKILAEREAASREAAAARAARRVEPGNHTPKPKGRNPRQRTQPITATLAVSVRVPSAASPLCHPNSTPRGHGLARSDGIQGKFEPEGPGSLKLRTTALCMKDRRRFVFQNRPTDCTHAVMKVHEWAQADRGRLKNEYKITQI
jgi:sRNA-binding protein